MSILIEIAYWALMVAYWIALAFVLNIIVGGVIGEMDH